MQDIGHEHVVKVESFDIAKALGKSVLILAQ
jgi:hypothetical protein